MDAARPAAAPAVDRTVGSAFGSALRAMQCAQSVVEQFLHYDSAFREITARAPARFAARDWVASQLDAVERIELYERCVAAAVRQLAEEFSPQAAERGFWREVKRHFTNLIEGLPDNEFCKTYFNSISRKLFRTVGVEPQIEFVATDLDPLASAGNAVPRARYLRAGSLFSLSPLSSLIGRLLADLPLQADWHDLDGGVRRVSEEIHARLGTAADPIVAIEVIGALFYQYTRAYAVGRIETSDADIPLLIALKNTSEGVEVDNVMATEAEISNLFGYTRSYFHVQLDHVADTVAYLKRLMPLAPLGELFTVLGRAKQGKTERNRSLFKHLESSQDLFRHAPGQPGLVMQCFTLPSLDVVFKVIRDHIPVQKNLSREEVMEKYDFVFKHDRAGRLIDAQEFRRLRVPCARFEPALLHDLLQQSSAVVHADGPDVVFDHLYIERRVTPLDIYLRSAPAADAVRAAVDYGHAIRDLAYTNIFAGDLLFKNFGVTQHGRVIFYDYDEVVPLTSCRFRELPAARDHEEEMSAEPWFAVNDEDVFPETFSNFLPFSAEQERAFLEIHAPILKVHFWHDVQRQLAAGTIMDVMPYVQRPRVA
jgi:isocitrate dehydrogenase kinase/phosphatase